MDCGSGLVSTGWGSSETMDPLPAGLQSRMACPHTGRPRFGEGRVGGGGWCLLIPRTLWAAGCQAHFSWCGSHRGFSVKRQNDCMNISLGKQCVGRGTSGRTLQGAGSLRRKQDCEMQRQWVGRWPLLLRAALSLSPHCSGQPPQFRGQRSASGAAVGKAVQVDIMGQLPGSPQHGSRCPVSPPRPVARSELLKEGTLNLQIGPQPGAGLGLEAA